MTAKKNMGCKIAVLVSLFVMSVAFIVSYLMYEDLLNEKLESVTEVCSTDNENFDSIYTTSTQESVNWVYNLTNPLDYLQDGAEANFHELGGYSYSVEVSRANPRFSDSGDKVKYTLYTSGTFDASRSPSGLARDDEIFSVNVAYLTVLGRARSEGVLMLSATCTLTQVGLMASTAAIPYCRPEEINTATMCRCCSPTALENATTCSDIASPTSQAGGLISYLAKMDGGMKLDSVASSFPLSSGAYSPLVTKKTVDALLLGTPSSLLGLFQYQAGTATDKDRIANTTTAMVEVCSVLGYCATLTELMGQISQAANMNGVLGILKALDCSGVIPDTAGLVAAGLTETRALELRYLDGVDCRPYTPTLVIAGLLMATAASGSSYTCESGTLPCCLSAYDVPNMASGAGLGCMLWVPGAMVTRNAYSVDEAYRYLTPSPDNELYTGCADEENAFKMISWDGRQEIDRWYVPDTYTYPSMPWADPVVVPVTAAGGVPGTMTVMNLTGSTVFGRRGTGINSDYLEYDLTDGKPVTTNETIVFVQGLTTKHLSYSAKSDVGGVPTNTFLFVNPENLTAAEDEVRQRTGEMPHSMLQNLRYSKGIAAIVSLPNYYGVDADIYSQSTNTDRVAAAGGGVSMYHTRDGYSASSALLTEPVVMTSATIADYASEMSGFTKIEPATGVALDTRAQNMASAFTWNCNPLLDATCGLLASAHNASDPLCYILGNGMQYPCSNANVFTPRVRGGKVVPVFWSRANLKPEGVVAIFLEAMDTRHALAIMSLVMPLLFLIALVVMLPGMLGSGGSEVKVAAYTPQSGDGDVETAKLVQGDANAAKIDGKESAGGD